MSPNMTSVGVSEAAACAPFLTDHSPNKSNPAWQVALTGPPYLERMPYHCPCLSSPHSLVTQDVIFQENYTAVHTTDCCNQNNELLKTHLHTFVEEWQGRRCLCGTCSTSIACHCLCKWSKNWKLVCRQRSQKAVSLKTNMRSWKLFDIDARVYK